MRLGLQRCLVQSFTRAGHAEDIQIRAAEANTGRLAGRHLQGAIDPAIGRVAHDAARAPVRAPDAAIDIDRGAIRDERPAVCVRTPGAGPGLRPARSARKRRWCASANRRNTAARRPGSCTVRWKCATPRRWRRMPPHGVTEYRQPPVWHCGSSTMVPLQNRPRRSTRPSLKRMPGTIASGRASHSTVVSRGVVQRNAAGESGDQSLAVRDQAERSDALGRIEYLHR